MSVGIVKKILSDKEVNCERQQEFDLARAVIIFCLALIHCTIECTSDEGLTKGIPYLFDAIIGGPFSAPMYMFVMGVGMVYTKNKEPMQYLKRGIKIFIAGYMLNICRFAIPYLLGYAITGEYGKYIEPLVYKVLGNDILIFAGLAMMILALFVKMKLSNIVMIIVGMMMAAAGTLLNGVDVGYPLGNIFLGYIIGTEDAAGMVVSDFPILNWMLFPICGYVFGIILKRVKDKKLFYLMSSIPTILIAIIYFTYGVYYEIGMFGEGQNCYYHMIFSDVLASLALTIGMVGVYYGMTLILPKKLLSYAYEISRNITYIYCIHWVLVSFVVNICIYISIGTQELAPWIVMILGSAISVVSIIIAYYFRLWKNRGKIYEKAS